MNDKNKMDKYRKMVIAGALRLDNPIGSYEDDEYFYEWLDHIYRQDLVVEFKKLHCFNSKEFSSLEKLNKVVDARYEEFHKTREFTQAMWQEIHDARQAFLNLPSVKKDIELLSREKDT